MLETELKSLSHSLWSATRRYDDRYPALAGDLDTDVTIIGAGYTGLSCALHLADRDYSVTVLDARQPGWGASGRNGGQVIAGLKEDPDDIEARFGPVFGPRIVEAAGQSPAFLFDLCRRNEIDCDMRDAGWIQLSHGRVSQEAQKRRVDQWQRRGAKVELLSADEAATRVGSNLVVGGLIDYRGGFVQPLNYAQGLAAAAARKGAKIFGDTPMLSYSEEGDGFAVRAPGCRIRTGQLVLCTNGYGRAAETGALARTVVPVYSVQVATAPLPSNLRSTILPGGQPASNTRRLLNYFGLDGEGRLVMGGRGTFGEAGRQRRQVALRDKALELFPQLRGNDVRWEHSWGGLVAMTGDHYPHLHELQPGLLAAMGFNGRGVAMATRLGAVLADRVSGVEVDALDYPLMPVQPIGFHAFRKLGVSAMVHAYRLLDYLGR